MEGGKNRKGPILHILCILYHILCIPYIVYTIPYTPICSVDMIIKQR